MVFGGRLVFAASADGVPFSLWESDGTVAGTRKLFDLPANVISLRELTALGPQLYFVANGGLSSADDQLWVSDGTEAGTRPLTSFETYAFLEPAQLVRAGGVVLFSADSLNSNRVLWKTDGTVRGDLSRSTVYDERPREVAAGPLRIRRCGVLHGLRR